MQVRVDDRVVLLIHGGWVITDPRKKGDGVLRDAAVAVAEDGTVAEVADYRKLRQQYPEAEIEGGGGYAVMPGMIDAHSHGMGLSYFELGAGYDHIESWNMRLPGLRRPDPYLDSIWCGIKHLRSGCTTIHHMGGAPEAPISAYRQLGVRWAFSLTVKDRNLVTYDDDAFIEELPEDLRRSMRSLLMPDSSEALRAYMEEFRRVHSEYATGTDPVMLGPMGPQWCSEELLKAVAREAHDLGTRIHMHAIQTPYQREAVRRESGCSPAEYLRRIEFLGDNLTLGHAVWFDEGDLDLLAESGCSVTHHASCNLNMRNGILPLPHLLSRGITVAIGVDGKGINDDEDILQEMTVVEKLHRLSDLSFGAPLSVTSEEIVAMATTSGAHVLGLEDLVGTLEPGRAADAAVIDVRPRPWISPDVSIADRLVMHARGGDVHTVVVGGQVLMRDREILTVDEEALLEELVDSIPPESSPGALARASLLRDLYPHAQDFYRDWDIPPGIRVEPFYPVNRR